MSMFLCAKCDEMADSDDGCEEYGSKFGLICIDCISNCEDDEEAYHTSDSPATEYERVERMRAENARKLQEDFERAMSPDYSRKGRFQTHNCYACDHGNKPCIGEKPVCQNMRARND